MLSYLKHSINLSISLKTYAGQNQVKEWALLPSVMVQGKCGKFSPYIHAVNVVVLQIQ